MTRRSRWLIGGLTLATFGTLFFVPVMYSVLRTKAPAENLETAAL